MVLILFNAFGSTFAASDFVAKHSIKDASVWKKGEPLGKKKKHEDSGFSLNLKELDTAIELAPLLESFIRESESWLVPLLTQPVDRLLNIGMTVGEEASYVSCIELEAKLLTLLVENKIGLHICGYPTSD